MSTHSASKTRVNALLIKSGAGFFRKMLCAGHVAGKLSDRVKRFFTLNACAAFELGHGSGVHAPGLKPPVPPPGRTVAAHSQG